MAMVKMLTLFGVDLKELKYNDLERELRVQKWIHYAINSALSDEIGRRKRTRTVSQLSYDKEAFGNIYLQHLKAFMTEIEYVMAHRSEPIENFNCHRSQKRIRQENEAKRKAIINENAKLYYMKQSMAQDGMLVSWDKERFILIASDRGYQTEEAIITDISQELNLDLARTRLLIDKGRFTWGQVLCLGAMMQMTPKEFCDTFLAGYFTEQYGEYRADYENLCKEELLKYAVKPKMPPPDEIEVGADGRPLDEEIWFDE